METAQRGVAFKEMMPKLPIFPQTGKIQTTTFIWINVGFSYIRCSWITLRVFVHSKVIRVQVGHRIDSINREIETENGQNISNAGSEPVSVP